MLSASVSDLAVALSIAFSLNHSKDSLICAAGACSVHPGNDLCYQQSITLAPIAPTPLNAPGKRSIFLIRTRAIVFPAPLPRPQANRNGTAALFLDLNTRRIAFSIWFSFPTPGTHFICVRDECEAIDCCNCPKCG